MIFDFLVLCDVFVDETNDDIETFAFAFLLMM